MKFPTLTALLLSTALCSAAPTFSISTREILPETKYKIVFDQAVIPLDYVHTEQPNNMLSIKPKLPGTLKWESRNVAHFVPSVAPQMNTEYTFKTTKGITYIDGTELEETQLAERSSQAFQQNYHRRYSRGNNRLPLSYLRYNDAISPKKLNKKFYYSNKEGVAVPATVRQAVWSDLESTYYIKPTWQQRFANHQLRLKRETIPNNTKWEANAPISNGIIVTPSSPLPVGENWTLIAKKGIPNADGSEKSVAQSTHKIWNIKPFQIEEIIPAVFADKDRSIYIDLNGNLPKELDQAALKDIITVSPTPHNLQFKRRYNDTIQITGDFRTQDTWKVNVGRELVSSNGLMLGKAVSKEITFHYVEPGLALAGFDSAQLSKGQRTFSVETVNTREVRVQIKALDNEQAIRGIQGYRHYSGDGHNYTSIKDTAPLPFELISGTTVYDTVIPIDTDVDTSHTLNFKWDEILPLNTQNATLFVSITGEPHNGLPKKYAERRKTQSIVQLTDLGLAWKVAKDKAWIYAYSLDTGEPFPNVSISMYGEDAKNLSTTITDTNGLAVISTNEADRHLIARTKDDQYIVTFDKGLDTVSMWRFPVRFEWEEQNFWQHKGMLFSDRNLYRPTETVRLKGVLRQYKENAQRFSDIDEVTLSIRDPRNREIANVKKTLSANGSFDHSFTLPDELVGRYSVICSLDGEDIKGTRRFSHSFAVQDFRRNAFEVKTNLPTPEIAAKDIQLDVDALYYQGTPVSEGTLQWFFSASQFGFYPGKFRDFQFADHREYDGYYWSHYFGYGSSNRYNNVEHVNGRATLSSDGSATVTAQIPSRDFPTPQLLKFTAEVTDSRDQTLTAVSSAIHYPASFYYGIERVDELIRVGDQKLINIVSVGTDGEYYSTDTTAEIGIVREYHESIKILGTDGTTRTTNEKRTENLGKEEITIFTNQTNSYAFAPEKSGRYILSITGKDANGNLTKTTCNVYVYGSNDYPWATEDGMRIKLVSEQKSYKPGDTARLLVMTPIEGTALITVERSGILKSYQRKLTASNPVIEFPVDIDFAPNAYVSVLVIRGSQASTHKFKEPALKLGYCEISVTNPATQLKIAINSQNGTTLPGDSATVSGNITDHTGKPVSNAEVVLFAEDEGTLAVMGYQNPNPHSYFHSHLPLTLRTGVTHSSFLAENPEHRYMGNKGFVIGGGDPFADAAGGMDEIENRTNFDPCAAWFPSLQTDNEGNFSASFVTPDTLTRYRIIAVAFKDAEKYGTATSSLVVKKDIMLEPKPPRFAHEGDQLETKVLIQNESPYSGEWEIALTTDSLCSLPNSSNNTLSQTVALDAGGSATLSFPASFVNTGSTTWTWKTTPVSLNGTQLTAALKKQLSDALENTFNITYPRPLLRETKFIRYQKGDKPIDLVSNMQPIIMNGRGHIDLEISNSLLLEAGGASEYLLRYPYGCAEQTTSSLMPWFAVRDLKGVVPCFGTQNESDIKSAIQKGVDRLLSMQTADGGLAYWPEGEKSEKWASIYGGMGIILAKQHGAQIPDASLKSLTQYVRKVVKQEAKLGWQTDSRARGLYVLALANAADIPTQNLLLSQKDKLSKTARSFLALAMFHSGEDKDICIDLMAYEVSTPATESWMRYRSDLPVQLLAWSTINPEGAQAEFTLQKMLDKRNPQGHWRTTWVNGWAMHAMANYARNVESNKEDISIKIAASDQTHNLELNEETPRHTLRVPLEYAQSLITQSTGKTYIRVNAASKPEIAPLGPTSNNGVHITRRYERLNEKGEASALDQPRVGDLVKVTLTIGLPENMRYIAIDDPLPSIFESVNDEFDSQSSVHTVKKNYRVSRTEFRNERTLFFLNYSWGSKKQEISYLARVTAAGTVHTPPAKVEAMYDPTTYGLSEAATLTTLPAMNAKNE